MRVIYQASDGKEFDTEQDCAIYENSLQEYIIVLNSDMEKIPIELITDNGFFVQVRDKASVTVLQNLGCKEIKKVGTYVWTEYCGGFILIDDILNAFKI